MKLLHVAIAITALFTTAQAQNQAIDCSATQDLSLNPWRASGTAAPLRGSVGCVDVDVQAKRDKAAHPVFRDQDAVNIYGPMEAGFTSATPSMSCLGNNVVPGGIDTNTAEHIVDFLCGGAEIQVLDSCGGHAVPYHYHERMSCLYTSDPVSGHSTRIGTAGDGNGIYGKHIDGGIEPTDLDACGGRFGVTPDSNGEVVYYYPISALAPFSLGCYGPATVEQCRAMYPAKCGANTATIETITTKYGSGQYALDCPCFDPATNSNVPGVTERPGFLEPLPDSLPSDVPSQSPTGENSDEPYDGPPPNFIIMQPDDLQFFQEWTPPFTVKTNARVNFPDNDGNGLPNIDLLRTNGLQMMNAYTASPMCGTSRYSTITGK